MASGGPKPPSLTRYRNVNYKSLVLAADPNWLVESQRVPEYEFPQPRGGKRTFYGWYQNRWPYNYVSED